MMKFFVFLIAWVAFFGAFLLTVSIVFWEIPEFVTLRVCAVGSFFFTLYKINGVYK